MSGWGWKPYVSVAARRKQAEAAAARARKAGLGFAPIPPSRGAIANTFWGKAWCENLEQYRDFENRLPRGRTYVRNGSVIDLRIGAGEVKAQVMGSSLYQVEVRIVAVAPKHWKAIGADCAGSIGSMIELLRGQFSTAVMQRLCRPADGLFPKPKEIQFTCSCPDWAEMCKHVAAVLYGVGARLDADPEVLFRLRGVDGNDLLARAGTRVMQPSKAQAKGRVLDTSDLADVFGIEMAGTTAPDAPAPRSAAPAVKKTVGRPPSKSAKTAAKTALKTAAKFAVKTTDSVPKPRTKAAPPRPAAKKTPRKRSAAPGPARKRIRTT